jgi:serine protease AprX
MIRGLLLALAAVAAASCATSAQPGADGSLDVVLRARAGRPTGLSRVMVRAASPQAAEAAVSSVNGCSLRWLPAASTLVAEVRDDSLLRLAAHNEVERVSLDRPVAGTIERTAVTIGARYVQETLGLDGTGIGVATIDSGVARAHDDLAQSRIVHFVDFVNLQQVPYDDYGHGTHVAGIIAGSGADSGGSHRGIAPAAHLVVLKALDATGGGFASNVIAALDYAVANRDAFNIRVINLSVAAGVYESYSTDPLALAAKRAVDAGIVVVAAAGNFGLNSEGQSQRGGIASPGNAPWVLTVGASDHRGTVDRSDDVVAPFSSKGPSAIDRASKPDVVAPGVGIESVADPGTVLFETHPKSRVRGSVETVSPPYLALSGTSMAAPAVTGTIALMLEANPALTPNAVKAIVEITAEHKNGYDERAQGAGFLDARAAVDLAREFAASSGRAPSAARAARAFRGGEIIWGNRRLSGGVLVADASAWGRGVTWGAPTTPAGDAIVFGLTCSRASGECTDVTWDAACAPPTAACGDLLDELAATDAAEPLATVRLDGPFELSGASLDGVLPEVQRSAGMSVPRRRGAQWPAR